MKYQKMNNLIKIYGKDDFCPKHIFECGQVFLYDQNSDGDYEISSDGKNAVVIEREDGYDIITKHVDYFENYFDLQTDYLAIKSNLALIDGFKKYIDFGHGIRILNQNILETIIGFVLSQNNNISRIKQTMQRICKDFHAQGKNTSLVFPSLDLLCGADEEYFKSIGAGYRARYLVDTISALREKGIENVARLTTVELEQFLLSIRGIGRKVADCILLFAFKRSDSFPVDTWVDRACCDLFGKTFSSRLQIRTEMMQHFGSLSGYAQQYLFYYYRENKFKTTR